MSEDMISECLKCGKKFTFTPVKGHVRRYCSIHCSHSHTGTGPKLHAFWRKGVLCKACGHLFIPINSSLMRYCSKECKKSVRHGRIPEKRDLDYIRRRIKIDKKTGCWIWQKSTNDDGYGQFGNNHKMVHAHKFVYELVKGQVPKGLILRHTCNHPSCCNPDHLITGTHKDNYADSLEVHLKASKLQRGKTTVNDMPITINGIYYSSVARAARSLGVYWKKAKAMADV